MSATVEQELPMLIAQVTVAAVERLSPSFVRVELAGPELEHFGVEGPLLDQRIKLVLPDAHGDLPRLGTGPTWYADWSALPPDRRGSMRTYTVREVRGRGTATRLVVDFVLHLSPGRTGPGSSWAAAARPGDPVVVVGPRRGHPYGGIEFAPGAARELLLAVDETGVPALCGILRDLDADTRGTAFAEVPEPGDVLPVAGPPHLEIVWLPRRGRPHGRSLVGAVRRHLHLPPVDGPVDGLVDERLVEPDLWETPTHSSTGERLEPGAGLTTGVPDLYAWIAGESRMVTTLRRCLVSELGLPRHQVAFMGYWREGVAMRS